jgi:hypothetical protein
MSVERTSAATLNYAAASRAGELPANGVAVTAWIFACAASVVVLGINFVVTVCICGHQTWHALPANVAVGSVMALGSWRERRPPLRVAAFAIAGLAVLAIAKVVYNMFWSGHDPFLR